MKCGSSAETRADKIQQVCHLPLGRIDAGGRHLPGNQQITQQTGGNEEWVQKAKVVLMEHSINIVGRVRANQDGNDGKDKNTRYRDPDCPTHILGFYASDLAPVKHLVIAECVR